MASLMRASVNLSSCVCAHIWQRRRMVTLVGHRFISAEFASNPLANSLPVFGHLNIS